MGVVVVIAVLRWFGGWDRRRFVSGIATDLSSGWRSSIGGRSFGPGCSGTGDCGVSWTHGRVRGFSSVSGSWIV